MFAHYDRRAEHISNENLDRAKTHLNYNLATEQTMAQGDFVKQRCSEVRCQNRKDVNVMVSWVVTAPKDLPKQEHKAFFQSSYEFLSNRYGRKNVISAYVHMDEVTPHMHFAFVPVVPDKKRGGFKVSAKEAVDRADLQSFHTDLQQHLERELGHEVNVLNEATKDGNRTIKALKRESAVERLQEARKTLEQLQVSIGEQERKIEAYKAIQGNLEGIQQISPKKIVPGMVTVKRRDFDVLKEQAQAFAAHQEELDHLQELRQQLDDRETRADERTAQLDQREKKIRTLENKTKLLYSQQVDINRVLEKTKAENKRLSNDYKSVQRDLTFYRDRAERLDKQAGMEKELRQASYNLARQLVAVTRAVELLGSPTKENNIFSPDENIWYQPQLTPEGMELINRVITSVESRLKDSGSIADLNFSALLYDLRVPAMTQGIYSPVFQKKEQERQRQKEKQAAQKKTHDFEIEL